MDFIEGHLQYTITNVNRNCIDTVKYCNIKDLYGYKIDHITGYSHCHSVNKESSM